MLIDQQETHEVVRQIVFKITSNRALHEDLAQEAIIHLWLRESEYPGQTVSWYFQSCRFHLQNYLRNGRSVDSTKRHGDLCSLAEAHESPGTTADESVSGGSLRSLVSAREAARLLRQWLTPSEREILGFLAEGFSIREIAAKLGTSHTSVIRSRRRIAALAAKLGIQPPAHHVGPDRPRSKGRNSLTP